MSIMWSYQAHCVGVFLIGADAVTRYSRVKVLLNLLSHKDF